MPEEPQTSQHPPVPTNLLDLLKLYMQQFGAMTFGTVTLVVVWFVMVRPQLEINQATLDAQREILESLHDLAESLSGSVNHIKQAVELQDRQMLRNPQ